jgi:DNA polymerase-3 subunit delta
MALPPDKQLQQALSRGDVDGAFFLFGDAPQQRDAAARRIVDHALDPSTRDFNLDRFRADDVDPETLAAALHTPPMLGDRRVVLLVEAQELGTAAAKVVETVLDALPRQLTFVITAGPTSGKAEKTMKGFAKRCRSYEWRVPREDALPGWLLEQARGRHGYELSERAAQAVADAIGPELGLLESELEKLSHAAEGGRVSLEAVRRLVPNVRHVNRWEWLDQVAARRYDGALASLPGLLSDSRESAVGLLAAMIDQHICLGIAIEGGAGLLGSALSEAGKPYLKWKARIYAQQARAWEADGLERALKLMRDADWHSKSGIGDRAALEELLLSLRLEVGQAA